MGDVVGKRIVDAESIEMQDRSGRPDGRTQQLTQQAPTAEARKRVVHEQARHSRRELGGLDLFRRLASADHPLARHPEVAKPTHLAERCLSSHRATGVSYGRPVTRPRTMSRTFGSVGRPRRSARRISGPIAGKTAAPTRCRIPGGSGPWPPPAAFTTGAHRNRRSSLEWCGTIRTSCHGGQQHIGLHGNARRDERVGNGIEVRHPTSETGGGRRYRLVARVLAYRPPVLSAVSKGWSVGAIRSTILAAGIDARGST